MNVKSQYLSYDFTYDGKKHKGKARLTESDPNVFMVYDDHDLELTWMKRIPHKGKHIVINIVVKDDWNDCGTLGKVAASAWVCVYDKRRAQIIEQFEPGFWAYIDEEDASNNVDKNSFYIR